MAEPEIVPKCRCYKCGRRAWAYFAEDVNVDYCPESDQFVESGYVHVFECVGCGYLLEIPSDEKVPVHG